MKIICGMLVAGRYCNAGEHDELGIDSIQDSMI